MSTTWYEKKKELRILGDAWKFFAFSKNYGRGWMGLYYWRGDVDKIKGAIDMKSLKYLLSDHHY